MGGDVAGLLEEVGVDDVDVAGQPVLFHGGGISVHAGPAHRAAQPAKMRDVLVSLGDQVLNNHAHAEGIVAADHVRGVDVVRSAAGKDHGPAGNGPVERRLVRHRSHHKQALRRAGP